jgi:hypothetical protein
MEIKHKIVVLLIILSNINSIYSQEYQIVVKSNYHDDKKFYRGLDNMFYFKLSKKSKDIINVKAKYGSVKRTEPYIYGCEKSIIFKYYASIENYLRDTLYIVVQNKKGDTIFYKNEEYKIINAYPDIYFLYNVEYQSSDQVVEVNDSVLFIGYGFTNSSLQYRLKSCDILLLRNEKVINGYSSDTTKNYIDRKIIDKIKLDYKSGDKLLIYNHKVSCYSLIFDVKPLEFYIKFK